MQEEDPAVDNKNPYWKYLSFLTSSSRTEKNDFELDLDRVNEVAQQMFSVEWNEINFSRVTQIYSWCLLSLPIHVRLPKKAKVTQKQ